MSIAQFDPFEDRLSRDIRNKLSTAFMETLETGEEGPIEQICSFYLRQGIAPFYRAYIADRVDRYNKAMTIIMHGAVTDVVGKALVLWDQELFFEVHELLEDAWLKAAGPLRLVLQALIRAAGVYVHLQRGNRKGAEKMAAKAVAAFKNNQQHVPASVDLPRLLAALNNLAAPPPKLFNVER